MTALTTPPPELTASRPADRFEFSPLQNIVIDDLASRMRAVGGALILLALIMLTWAILGAGSRLFVAEASLVLGCIGLWSYRAGLELKQVARTEGADVAHLMNALGEIRKLYDLQYWVFLAAALLMAVTLLVAIAGRGPLPSLW